MITTRKSALLVLVALISMTFSSNASAQNKADVLSGVKFEQSKKDVEKRDETLSTVPPDPSGGSSGLPFSCEGISDKNDQEKEVHVACLNALKEHFGYESERLKHRKWVFRFQLIATNISFVIVLVMVGFGLRFAQIQFLREFPTLPLAPTPAGSPMTTPAHDSSTTDIEISLARIKVSSSILGVIILALAMGFFYLYIQFVFPIQGVQ